MQEFPTEDIYYSLLIFTSILTSVDNFAVPVGLSLVTAWLICGYYL